MAAVNRGCWHRSLLFITATPAAFVLIVPAVRFPTRGGGAALQMHPRKPPRAVTVALAPSRQAESESADCSHLEFRRQSHLHMGRL